jgi:hypothetical protein
MLYCGKEREIIAHDATLLEATGASFVPALLVMASVMILEEEPGVS